MEKAQGYRQSRPKTVQGTATHAKNRLRQQQESNASVISMEYRFADRLALVDTPLDAQRPQEVLGQQ